MSGMTSCTDEGRLEDLVSVGSEGLRGIRIETLQVNVGLRCNQNCQHCHLDCSPARPEMMDRNTMSAVTSAALLPGVSLVDITGRTHELTGVLTAVLSALHAEFSALGRRDPTQAGRWQARSLLNGREIVVQQGSRRTSGRCQGIGEDGRLMLACDDGLQCITSGHVFQVTPPLERKTDSINS